MSEFGVKKPEEYGFKDIIYEKADRVARMTINRPQAYNAYTTYTLSEINTALQDASFDDAIGVVVVTGAGNQAFCTGGDVKEYEAYFTRHPHDFWKYMGYFSRMIELLKGMGKPVIARINGQCVGGGNEINAACDLAIAAEHATIRQVGNRVGSVACGGATQFLPIIIGDRRAREMLLFSEPIDAKTALDWGLVNKVVPYEKLDEAVDEYVQKLLDKFPECTRYTQAQVNFWKDLPWHMTVPHAKEWLSLHFGQPEPWEGMRAFVEKRAPRYRWLRDKAASGEPAEYLHGAPVQQCPTCGTQGIPEKFSFCGNCGTKL